MNKFWADYFGPGAARPFPGLFFLALDHGGTADPAAPACGGGAGDPDADANGPPDPNSGPRGGSGDNPLPTPSPSEFPDNDDRSMPVPINPMESIDFDTEGATQDGPAPPCGSASSDLWYSFAPNVSGSWNASLTNQDYSAVVAIYDAANVSAAAALACSSSSVPQALFSTQAGHSYLIQVGGLSGAQGIGTVNLAAVTGTGGGGGGVAAPGTGRSGLVLLACALGIAGAAVAARRVQRRSV